MTQKSASDIAKMSRVHWARIERGQATKRSALFQIAEALNLPPATILGWAGFKFEDGVNGTVETTLTPLFDYKGISASERTKLRPLLEMLDREIERLQKMHG